MLQEYPAAGAQTCGGTQALRTAPGAWQLVTPCSGVLAGPVARSQRLIGAIRSVEEQKESPSIVCHFRVVSCAAAIFDFARGRRPSRRVAAEAWASGGQGSLRTFSNRSPMADHEK